MELPSKLGYLIYLLRSEFPDSEIKLVGGCVRDFLLGVEPKDFDLATNIPMELVNEVLSRGGFKVDTSGQVFLVLNASKDGEHYEIANFRKDGKALDGRHPDSVEVGTIEEDAARRDFTVNAIYYDPRDKSISSPIPEAITHVATRTLKFIGKPQERIREDYLRVFRFYRFLACKKFNPDVKSMKACREYFKEAYENTNPERVREELERMIDA